MAVVPENLPPEEEEKGGKGGKPQGPQEGDTRTINGVIYQYLDGEWVKVFNVGEGGGSSSSGGGGFGGGGGAPADPLVGAGSSLYFQLWGQKAPQGYIEGLVKKGYNLIEIEMHERSKPAFSKTEVYRKEIESMGAGLLRFLGVQV